jgi:hypothetical protein
MSLPILSSQFFDKHSPDLGFFSKWRSFYQWSDQILPIYEWNDVLYVACLQPPQKFPPTTQKIVFLLCEPEALKNVWYSFEGTVVYSRPPSLNVSPPAIAGAAAYIPTPIEPVEEMPVAAPAPPPEEALEEEHSFALDLNESTSEEPVEAFKLDFGADDKVQEKTVAESTVIDEVLEEESVEVSTEGLRLDFGAPSAEPLSEAIDEKTPLPISLEAISLGDPSDNESKKSEVAIEPDVASAKPQKQAASEDPMDLLAGAAQIKGGAPADPIGSLLQDGPGELADEEALASGEETVEAVEELLDFTGAGETPGAGTATPSPLIALQPLEPQAQTPPNSSVGKSANQPAEKRATPSKTEAVPFNSDVTRVSINTLNSVPQEKMDPWMEKLFSELGAHYQKSMILLKSGDQVKPWKWDGRFNPATPAVTSVTLLQPSPFRIVHRTHKPFHGYVVPNDLNTKFFAQWNASQTPEHITIAPVMIDDHVIGMLLAIGEKTADTKACLHLTESLANSIASQIKSATKAA